MANGEDERNTVRVKIHGAEFEATGSEESVNVRFEAFMRLATRLAETAPTQLREQDPDAGAIGGQTNLVMSGSGTLALPPGPIDGAARRVFGSKDDVVSLLVCPSGDDSQTESILLLLYGHRREGRENVLVDNLLVGLRQSGVQLHSTIGKVVGGTEGLFTKSGIKRGTRYGLTNRGAKRAEEVLMQII